MLTPQSLPWADPLTLAAGVDEPYFVLLYSGVQASYSGRYSYLAHGLAERVEGTDFSDFERKPGAGGGGFDNAWFGYLGYGLKDGLERLAPDRPGWLALPNLCMMRFHTIYQFDHLEQKLTRWSDVLTSPPPIGGRPGGGHNKERLSQISPHPNPPPMGEGTVPSVISLRSNMTHEEYRKKAAYIIECIHRGDLYQANLTRKFNGSFSDVPDAFALFRKLCAVSPAPYSAFMRLGEYSILSSSPELFLHVDAHGRVRTRPIKGTAARFADTAQDDASRRALEASAKDRAENLMIADLMRNDVSRSCLPGSVRAESLFEVTSHATIHHMSSTITGTKHPGYSALDAVKGCFPPGSMTGAPKIMAMSLCSRMEEMERGIYSGALGWFGGDGSCELSVVIRTLILHGRDFEFQVGGGIVADSTPEGELNELVEKSKGILLTLGISPQKFIALTENL